MNNFGLRQAKEQIIGFLNGLPYDLEVKRLLVGEVYAEVKQAADLVIVQENEALQKSLKEAKDGTRMATDNNADMAEHTVNGNTSERDKP